MVRKKFLKVVDLNPSICSK